MPTPSRSFTTKALLTLAVFAGLFACAGADDPFDDEDDGIVEPQGETTSELKTAGPCAGTAIDRAVQCAVRKGAKVLSYYRSVAEQERVRRENHCTNRCTGMQGCVRPTANCNSSPHTRCRAVDLV